MSNPNLLQVSMVITKASLQPDGSMRWQAVTSDTSPDSTGEATSLALFQDWNERIDKGLQVDWLPPPREPFLGVSHYSDLEGYGEAGLTHKRYIDGFRFKAAGTFRSETPIGPALFEAVRSEFELVRRGEVVPQPIRISAAWWDISHSHGSFVFERKSLTDVCPMCAAGEGNKVYLKGQLDHFAATRVPINPRTSLALEEKSEMGTTRKQDAATIIEEELAEELESKSKLIGKSEVDEAIVIKAKKPPKEEEDEEDEDEDKDKKKKKMPPWLKGKSFSELRALPEARNLSRFALIGLIRQSTADLPEGERLGVLEALLDEVDTEIGEIREAVEDLYFLQPVESEETMTDYLEEFTQAVEQARAGDQSVEQKAALMQEALNKLVPAMKADLEPQAAPGDMVAAFKAALSPLADQLAQLTARLNVGAAPVVQMPVQRSLTVQGLSQPVQPQNQLPTSPITGQPSQITALVRRNTGL